MHRGHSPMLRGDLRAEEKVEQPLRWAVSEAVSEAIEAMPQFAVLNCSLWHVESHSLRTVRTCVALFQCHSAANFISQAWQLPSTLICSNSSGRLTQRWQQLWSGQFSILRMDALWWVGTSLPTPKINSLSAPTIDSLSTPFYWHRQHDNINNKNKINSSHQIDNTKTLTYTTTSSTFTSTWTPTGTSTTKTTTRTRTTKTRTIVNKYICVYIYIYIYIRDIVKSFCRHNFDLGGYLGLASARMRWKQLRRTYLDAMR